MNGDDSDNCVDSSDWRVPPEPDSVVIARLQDKLDRFEAALRRIVEIGEDATCSARDWLQAFKIADDALNPRSAQAIPECSKKEESK